MRKWTVLSVISIFLFFDVLPLLAADVKFSGDFRVRGFYTDNLTDAYDSGTSGAGCGGCNDEAAYNSTRFLLTTTATAGVATGVVTMDFTSAGSTGNLKFGEAGGPYGPKDDRFALIQAYIQADLQLATLAAGRKLFILGHSIILDDPVDGIFLDLPLGPATLSLSTMKIRDTTSTAVGVPIGDATGAIGTGGDTDFYVGNLAFRPVPDLATNFFVGYYKDRTPTFLTVGLVTDADLYILGATADAKVGPLTLGGEIDYLTGSTDVSSGSEFDLEGLNVQLTGGANVGPADVWLTIVYASGQDPSSTTTDLNINGLDGNYPIGIILTNGGARSLAPKDGTCITVDGAALGGVPGCALGSGLLAFKGTGKISPVERLSLQGDVIWARSTEDPSSTVSEKDIGVELDGTVRYAVDDNFSLLAGIGYLIAGDWWKSASTAPSPDNLIVGVLEARFMF